MIQTESQTIDKTRRERQRIQTTIFKTEGVSREDGMFKRKDNKS